MFKTTKNIIKKNFTKMFWKSRLSHKWHQRRKDNFTDDFENLAETISKKVNHMEFTTVIEIGTGTGTLITLLSERLLGCKKFLGIDINRYQINKNKKNNTNDNVEYKCIEALEFFQKNRLDKCLIIAQNTFGYFNKTELEKIFKYLYENMDNVVIITNSTKNNIELKDSVVRNEADLRVYNHNYSKIFQKVGFLKIDIDFLDKNENSLIITAKKPINI